MPLKFSVHTEGLDDLKARLRVGADKAGAVVAAQVYKDTMPYVPALTGSLSIRARVVKNSVIYPGPYARYLYYGKVMVDENGNGPKHYVDKFGNEQIRFPKGSKLHATDRNLVFSKKMHPQAQAHWFEASKAQNLDKWMRVAEKAVNKFGEG